MEGRKTERYIPLLAGSTPPIGFGVPNAERPDVSMMLPPGSEASDRLVNVGLLESDKLGDLLAILPRLALPGIQCDFGSFPAPELSRKGLKVACFGSALKTNSGRFLVASAMASRPRVGESSIFMTIIETL